MCPFRFARMWWLVLAAVLMAAPAEGGVSGGMSCEQGDVSGDGTVTMYDVALIRARLLGMDQPESKVPEGWEPGCAPIVDAGLLARCVGNLSPIVMKETVVNLDDTAKSGLVVTEAKDHMIVVDVPAGSTLPVGVGDVVTTAVGDCPLGRVVFVEVSDRLHTLHIQRLWLGDVVESGSFTGTFVLQEVGGGLEWKDARDFVKGGELAPITFTLVDQPLLEAPGGSIIMRVLRLSITPTLHVEAGWEHGMYYWRTVMSGPISISGHPEISAVAGFSHAAAWSGPKKPLYAKLVKVLFIPILLTGEITFPVCSATLSVQHANTWGGHFTFSGNFRNSVEYRHGLWFSSLQFTPEGYSWDWANMTPASPGVGSSATVSAALGVALTTRAISLAMADVTYFPHIAGGAGRHQYSRVDDLGPYTDHSYRYSMTLSTKASVGLSAYMMPLPNPVWMRTDDLITLLDRRHEWVTRP